MGVLHIAQGYGIAKPMPAAQIKVWLVQWKLNPYLVSEGT
jgi:hypothetical protein